MRDREEEAERKKRDEQNWNFHLWLSQLLRKVSETYGVHLAIEYQRDQYVHVVSILFAFLYFFFHGAVAIPYLKPTIFNLPHCYLKSTTVLHDSQSYVHVVSMFCNFLGKFGFQKFGKGCTPGHPCTLPYLPWLWLLRSFITIIWCCEIASAVISQRIPPCRTTVKVFLWT